MTAPQLVKRAAGSIKLGRAKPLWLDTVTNLYPPIQFALPAYIKATAPGRVPKPPKIAFPEDLYRRRFFKEHPTEVLKVTYLNENRSSVEDRLEFSTPDDVIDGQKVMMEQGVDAETAYNLSLANYKRKKQRLDLENRIAQEQLLHSSSMPASAIIEDFLREERDIIKTDRERSD